MTRLRELIEENQITQKRLASDLGFPPQTLNNYVRGEREPDIETIARLCDYFACTADYFLCRSLTRSASISDEEARILQAYKSATPRDRALVDQILAAYMEDAKKRNAV